MSELTETAWSLWVKHGIFTIPVSVTRNESGEKSVRPFVRWVEDYDLRDPANQTDENLEKVWDGHEDAPGIAAVIPPGHACVDPDTPEALEYVHTLDVGHVPSWESLRGTKYLFQTHLAPAKITFSPRPGLEVRCPGSLLILPPTPGWSYLPGHAILDYAHIPHATPDFESLFRMEAEAGVVWPPPVHEPVKLPDHAVSQGEGRHKMLLEQAGKYGSKLNPEDLFAYLVGINERYCDPPYGDEHVRDIVDWIVAQEARSLEERADAEGFPKLRFHFLSNDGDEAAPAVLQEPFVYEAKSTTVFGPSGDGKSIVADWMMRELSVRGVHSVLFDTEDAAQERRRLRRMGADMDYVHLADLNTLDLMEGEVLTGFAFGEPGFVPGCIEAVQGFGAQFVVFNCYDDLKPTSEAAYDGWNAGVQYVARGCRAIIAATGAAVWMIDHQEDRQGEHAHGGRMKKRSVDLYMRVTADKPFDPEYAFRFRVEQMKTSRIHVAAYDGIVTGDYPDGELKVGFDRAEPATGFPAVYVDPAAKRW